MDKVDINKNEIPPEHAGAITSFCESLIILHSKNLISVAVYGSAVTSNFVPKISNINIVCVFNELKMETMNNSLRVIKQAKKNNIVAPLFLTLDNIRSSLDTFPMEFLEIKENHRTVYGQKIFSQLDIPKENLRIQCEQQLKSQLVRLRQMYLEHGNDKKAIKSALITSFNSTFAIFRSLLRLAGVPVPELNEEVILKVNNTYSFDGQVFSDLLKDKKKLDKVVWRECDDIFAEYLLQLEVLANRVDQMKVEGHS
ncbi:MAG: hypothetical protein RBU23_03060 [Candidatus Auribacterota bacterium]|jgi:hypothetical protein|nr:hypothetical protein [Candidatus Auribacterota bacterium]